MTDLGAGMTEWGWRGCDGREMGAGMTEWGWRGCNGVERGAGMTVGRRGNGGRVVSVP